MRKLSPSKLITYGAMCAALTVLSLYAASVLPTMKIACMFLSSVFIYVLASESAFVAAILTFAASAAISFMIIPDKMYAAIYVALIGHYGIFRAFITGRTGDRILEFCLRMLYCNVFTGAAILVAIGWLSYDFAATIAGFDLPVWALIVILEASFAAFDVLHFICQKFYNERIRPYLVPRR